MSFRDNAWLSDGCNEITGQQLVYNIKTQSVQGQSTPAPHAGATAASRITIQPQVTDPASPARKRRRSRNHERAARHPSRQELQNAAK